MEEGLGRYFPSVGHTGKAGALVSNLKGGPQVHRRADSVHIDHSRAAALVSDPDKTVDRDRSPVCDLDCAYRPFQTGVPDEGDVSNVQLGADPIDRHHAAV